MERTVPATAFTIRGVVAVEQAIRLAAPPPGIEWQTNLQDSCDHAQFLKRQPLKKARLDESDQLLAHPSALGHVSLSPAQPQANQAKERADMLVVHTAIIVFGSLPPTYRPIAHTRERRSPRRLRSI